MGLQFSKSAFLIGLTCFALGCKTRHSFSSVSEEAPGLDRTIQRMSSLQCESSLPNVDGANDCNLFPFIYLEKMNSKEVVNFEYYAVTFHLQKNLSFSHIPNDFTKTSCHFGGNNQFENDPQNCVPVKTCSNLPVMGDEKYLGALHFMVDPYIEPNIARIFLTSAYAGLLDRGRFGVNYILADQKGESFGENLFSNGKRAPDAEIISPYPLKLLFDPENKEASLSINKIKPRDMDNKIEIASVLDIGDLGHRVKDSRSISEFDLRNKVKEMKKSDFIGIQCVEIHAPVKMSVDGVSARDAAGNVYKDQYVTNPRHINAFKLKVKENLLDQIFLKDQSSTK